MDNNKRRDLLNYFENKYKDKQKKYFNISKYSSDIAISFVNFLSSTRLLEKDEDFLDEKLQSVCVDAFNIKKENILIRTNIFDAINIIIKTYIELYENVLIEESIFELYEKFVLVNKARVYKTVIDYKNDLQANKLLDKIKYENIKMVLISSENIDYIYELTKNTQTIIVVEDFNNNIPNYKVKMFIEEFNNIFILKSIYNMSLNKNDLTSFLFSDEINIFEMNCLTNYCDMNLITKIFIIYQLKTLKNNEYIDLLDEITNNKNDCIIENKIAEIEEESKEQYKPLEIKDEENQNIDNDVNEIVEENTEKIIRDKPTDILEVMEEYTPNLIAGNRESLIEEFTKFKFINIFSSNLKDIYIESSTPIYSYILQGGIVLKKYNSSNGEIIRISIENTSQNIKVLKIINHIANTRKIYDVFTD